MHDSANPQSGLTLAAHIRQTVIDDLSQGALAPGYTLGSALTFLEKEAAGSPEISGWSGSVEGRSSGMTNIFSRNFSQCPDVTQNLL